MIPKIAHFIWMGSVLPKKYAKCIQTFIAHNPDWQVNVWKEEAFEPEFGEVAKFYKPEEFKYAVQRFDLYRYLILQKYGGVYLDADMMTIDSFNGIIDTDFFAGFETMRKPEYCHKTHNIKKGFGVNNAVIGCTPHHDVINNMLWRIENRKLGPYEMDFRVSMGPKLIEMAVKDCGKEKNILPMDYFFPIDYFEQIRYNKVSGNTVAIHLYDGGQDGY